MRPLRTLVFAALAASVALAAFLLQAAPAAAQGVTTAAISGTVTGEDGAGIENVTVTVTNNSTGIVSGSLTDEDGDYLVPGLQIGGPYTVTAGAGGLGFREDSRSGIRLTLGQRLDLDFRLAVEAVEVAGITATINTTDQIINPGRTGQQTLVTENLIENTPSIGRNFTDFIDYSPLSGAGGGATSVGGVSNRFNNVQLDGVVTQDLFGLSGTGQPGGQAGARSISIETVKEYRILAAPFDVRQSGFVGGTINAVTKNGTNEWEAAVYGYFRNQDFVRDELEGVPFGEFENKLYGGTFGGPIVKDRVHFFAGVELEQSDRPGGDVAIGLTSPEDTHLAEADAVAVAQRLEALGVDPGGFGAFTVENPNTNLFGRIDAQLSPNHTLTLRHNYTKAEDDVVQNRFGSSTYSFDSNFYFFESKSHAFVSSLNSTFGSTGFNELTFGYTRVRDRRTPVVRYPQVEIRGFPDPDGTGTTTIRVGAEEFSQANELDQDMYEISDNLSFDVGDNHRVTVGFTDQIFKFRNLFLGTSTGVWTFNNLAAFQAGTPSNYRRAVLHPTVSDPNAQFTVNQLGIYGQTEYRGWDNVVLTAGLRYDVPFYLDEPNPNPAVEVLGRSTDEMPNGNGILSPRLGFNWDVNGEGITQVRGGVGLFAGRQPYVWVSNLYTNTGLFSATFNCSGAGVPVFTLDPDNQATSCVGGSVSFPTPVVNTVDPDFESPSAWRFDLAVDRELPWNIVGTAEFLFTKFRNNIIYQELNIDFGDVVSTTQGGRPVYGTHTPGPLAAGANNNGLAQLRRIDPGFHGVLDLTNSDEDRQWNFILQAVKRYSDGFELNASYTLSDAEEVSGLTSSIATSNFGFQPISGNPNDPPRVTSDYEQRHKITLGGTWDVASWLTWSAFYVGASGDGYSYVYDGDVNADGFEHFTANNRFNDLVYVPTDASDITLVDPSDWAALDAFISSEECLSDARGRIIQRNECQEPWRHRVDTRFTFKLPTISGQHGEFVFDLFNVLNLVNEDWGRSEGVGVATIDLLELRGWDVANNRGIFDLDNVNLDDAGNADPLTIFDTSSRWQAQIGFRYEIN